MDDPYAAAFVAAAAASAIPAPVGWPDPDAVLSDRESIVVQSSCYVGLRSRLLDDYLRAACVDGVRQVVILAGGTSPVRADHQAVTDG